MHCPLHTFRLWPLAAADYRGTARDASVLIQKFLSTLSLDGDGTATKPFDGREDILGGLGPAEGLGVGVAGVGGGDCRLQRLDGVGDIPRP